MKSATVLVVAAGRGAAEQAALFGYYHCQNRRSFRPFEYIAFYTKNAITCYAEVNEGAEHDVVMSERPELRGLAEHTEKNNGDPTERHSLYRLNNVKHLDPPVVNDKIGANGSRVAFTQRHRYTTLDKLRAARTTTDLE